MTKIRCEKVSLSANLKRSIRILSLAAAICLCGSTATLGSSLAEELAWKDVDGNVVTFQSLEEMEDFLLTAEVLKVKRAPEGTTAPQKVLLERNGIRLYACFRYVKVNRPQIRLASGAIKFNFRDDAIFEIAAYRLSRLLGFQNVPPTVIRSIRGKKGTLQAWVPDCITEADRVKQQKQPQNAWRWAMAVQAMQLFDVLIYNEDRNLGNVLIDSDWDIWMIDHTRSFRVHEEATNLEQVKAVERGVWKGLNGVTDASITDALAAYLSEGQILALLVRRATIREHLGNLIEEQGENRVLYTLWRETE